MPRPSLTAAAPWVVLALVCGVSAPSALQSALAATAGILFEAAPFVLAGEALGRWRPARFVPLLGCGCGRSGLPGALAPAATALAWLAFGPLVAVARFALAAALAARAAPRGVPAGRSALEDPPDAFAELAALAPAAFAAALTSQALAATSFAAAADGRARWLLFAAGAGLGVLAPCATAAVAIAASLVHTAPSAAAGVLCTAGFFAPPRPNPRGLLRAALRLHLRSAGVRRGAGFASVLLALALAVLACRGASGFVTPRLRGCIAVAALVAAAGARRRTTRVPRAALLPAALLGALVAGSPPPAYRAQTTALDDAYPGARVDFTGVSTTVRGATTLERYVITCCRIDAAPVAVRLNVPLSVTDGTWVVAGGTLVRAPGGNLVLHTERWRRVAAPRDPFAYR